MSSTMLELYHANNFDPTDFVDDEDIPFEDLEIVEARERGFQVGFSAGSIRIAEVMNAGGVAGNGRRMSIALDLAAKAPDMSAQAVVEHVCSMASETGDGQISQSADEYAGTAMNLGCLVRYGMHQAAQNKGVIGMSKVDHKAIYEARKTQAAARDASEEDGAALEGKRPPATLSDPAKVYASRRNQQDK